jgi:hypothetical protein
MKTEDLQALGLDEDQIKKVFELSGKDVNAEKKKTQAAEADRDQWKTRAETAEDTLKGFDGVDVDGLNKQIEDWKNKAAEAQKDFQKQIEERDFADALKEEMEAFKFTSEAAKKAIMAEVKEAGLKLKNGKILGLSDLIGQIKEKDASAFAPDKDPAKFTDPPKDPQGNQTGFSKLSLAEKMKYANEHPTSADVIEWLKK